MSEEEIWLLFMHAGISTTVLSIRDDNFETAAASAVYADMCLEEWRKRYGDEQGSDVGKT